VSNSDTLGDHSQIVGPANPALAQPIYSKTQLGNGLVFENYPQSGLIEVPEMDNPAHVLILRSGSPSVIETRVEGRHRRVELPPCSVSFVPMGYRHAAKVFRPLPGVASILQIHPGFLNRAMGDVAKSGRLELVQQVNLDDSQIKRLMETLRSEVADGLPAGRLFGESIALALSAHIAQRYSGSSAILEAYRGGLSRSRLKRVFEYIDAHLAGNLELQVLASVAGLNMHHFARAFKQSTGEAPHQFVLRRRVEQAKQLLRHSQVPVIEASARTGFVDQSHFSKVFRRLVGLAPSEYRNRG
jgi:AraC family transcriptional regulator